MLAAAPIAAQRPSPTQGQSSARCRALTRNAGALASHVPRVLRPPPGSSAVRPRPPRRTPPVGSFSNPPPHPTLHVQRRQRLWRWQRSPRLQVGSAVEEHGVVLQRRQIGVLHHEANRVQVHIRERRGPDVGRRPRLAQRRAGRGAWGSKGAWGWESRGAVMAATQVGVRICSLRRQTPGIAVGLSLKASKAGRSGAGPTARKHVRRGSIAPATTFPACQGTGPRWCPAIRTV